MACAMPLLKQRRATYTGLHPLALVMLSDASKQVYITQSYKGPHTTLCAHYGGVPAFHGVYSLSSRWRIELISLATPFHALGVTAQHAREVLKSHPDLIGKRALRSTSNVCHRHDIRERHGEVTWRPHICHPAMRLFLSPRLKKSRTFRPVSH